MIGLGLLMKPIAIGASVLALTLAGSTLYYRVKWQSVAADLAGVRAELVILTDRLTEADRRAKAAEAKLVTQTAYLVETHNKHVASIERAANEREAKLRKAVSEQMALLNSCRLSRDIVGLLNDPVPSQGDADPAAAAGAGGAAAPDAGADSGVSCGDLAVWASQVREAKELNDAQLVSIQQHYENVRATNNALLEQ